jgi:hypothetical protein
MIEIILCRTAEKGKPYCPGSVSKTVSIRRLFDQSGKLKRKPSGGEWAWFLEEESEPRN